MQEDSHHRFRRAKCKWLPCCATFCDFAPEPAPLETFQRNNVVVEDVEDNTVRALSPTLSITEAMARFAACNDNIWASQGTGAHAFEELPLNVPLPMVQVRDFEHVPHGSTNICDDWSLESLNEDPLCPVDLGVVKIQPDPSLTSTSGHNEKRTSVPKCPLNVLAEQAPEPELKAAWCAGTPASSESSDHCQNENTKNTRTDEPAGKTDSPLSPIASKDVKSKNNEEKSDLVKVKSNRFKLPPIFKKESEVDADEIEKKRIRREKRQAKKELKMAKQEEKEANKRLKKDEKAQLKTAKKEERKAQKAEIKRAKKEEENKNVAKEQEKIQQPELDEELKLEEIEERLKELKNESKELQSLLERPRSLTKEEISEMFCVQKPATSKSQSQVPSQVGAVSDSSESRKDVDSHTSQSNTSESDTVEETGPAQPESPENDTQLGTEEANGVKEKKKKKGIIKKIFSKIKKKAKRKKSDPQSDVNVDIRSNTESQNKTDRENLKAEAKVEKHSHGGEHGVDGILACGHVDGVRRNTSDDFSLLTAGSSDWDESEGGTASEGYTPGRTGTPVAPLSLPDSVGEGVINGPIPQAWGGARPKVRNNTSQLSGGVSSSTSRVVRSGQSQRTLGSTVPSMRDLLAEEITTSVDRIVPPQIPPRPTVSGRRSGPTLVNVMPHEEPRRQATVIRLHRRGSSSSLSLLSESESESPENIGAHYRRNPRFM